MNIVRRSNHFRQAYVRYFSENAFKASSSKPLIVQRYGESRSRSYEINNGIVPAVDKKEDENINLKISNMSEDILAYFLPKGYPHSVGKGYDQYIKFQAIAMVFSTTGGVLSMQSMLYAIGAGSGSVPLAATLNWIIKDGLGQLGGVIFASVVSNKFDADPKRWRMVASGSMDISSFLELLTPIFPHLFLPIASVANVGKNISFLAASASRAAAHRSFATHENLADITAKSGSQSILCSMIGTGVGISVATLIGSFDPSLTYPLTVSAFLLCSGINLTSTYISLKSVTLTTLNPDRLDFIFDTFIKKHEFLTPTEFSKREWLLGAPLMDHLPQLKIGSDLNQAFSSSEDFNYITELYQNEKYIITCDTSKNIVHILYKSEAQEIDILTGLLEAYKIRLSITDKKSSTSTTTNNYNEIISDVRHEFTSENNSQIKETVHKFLDNLMMTTDDNNPEKLTNQEKKSNSTYRNSYPQWLIETLMLETRYARLE